MDSPEHIVVIGAGITGLSTAYSILSRAQKLKRAVSVTVLEAQDRVGGNIQTDRVDGFVLDGGPDAFLRTKPQATQLCKELGLENELIETSAENRKLYVLLKNKLHPFPDGMMLTVPSQMLPLIKSPLLSWKGKFRILSELFIGPNAPAADESIGSFVRRRLGQEALDRLAEPLLGGIYAGNVESVSIRSTFPQLLELERKHGSLIRGAIQQMKAAAKMPSSAKSNSVFYSLRNGLQELISSLMEKINAQGGVIQTNTQVLSVAIAPDGYSLRTHVNETDQIVSASQLVVTTPTYAAAEMFKTFDPVMANMLSKIPYVSTVVVFLGYKRTDIDHPLDSVGFIIPRSERVEMLATTFVSSKWQHRAPEGSVLFRVFLGGYTNESVADADNDVLIEKAIRELSAVIPIKAKPILARVYKHKKASAQPIVGHQEQMSALRQHAKKYKSLYFAGAAIEGVGIPDCIRQAQTIAEQIIPKEEPLTKK